jgi:mRNA-degrading endonuclease RelE of RelBE toxin-antitoxin system
MYEIVWEHSAWKELEALSSQAQEEVVDAIDGLARDGEPASSTPLRSDPTQRRLRIRSYRVLYQVSRKDERVVILAVGNRKDIYR